MLPNVTIVISNCDYDSYVGSCIQSVLAQSVPCKVIVVDDASQDKSWDEICKFRGSVVAVRLKENSGGNARGKNIGIALSDTEYIACFDSDDMMTSRSIELRMEALTRKRAEWSSGFCQRVESTGSYDELRDELNEIGEFPLVHRERIKIKEMFCAAGTKLTDALFLIGGTTVLAKRSLYERFGLFDEGLKWKIDKEMWMRWLSRDITPAFVVGYVAIYRRHSRSTTWMNSNYVVGNDGRYLSKKNPRVVNIGYDLRVKMRSKGITPENTLMLDNYDPMRFIEEVVL